jgi:GNAT superfamily N-acetyltransferase
MVDVEKCATESDFSCAMQLTRDYIAWLDLDLSFQDIDREFSCFPAMYGPPDGLFLLAREDGRLAGGVGLRPLAPGICEMKRLFVYDRFKGRGVGKVLCTRLLEEARRLGYGIMRLDTLGRMNAAIGLYQGLGFRDIEAYRFNPDPTARFMELPLK